MRLIIVRLTLACILFTSTWLFITHLTEKNNQEVMEHRLGDEKYELKATEAMEAMRSYNAQRAFPADRIPIEWREQAEAHTKQFNLNKLNAIRQMTWTSVGPDNIAGRVRSVTIDPTNPNIIYSGSVSGGIWKSTNAGNTWTALTDNVPNLVIGCIAIDHTNPNIIYAGTGEGYYNVDALRGIGVLKSTDGGATWTVLKNFTNASAPNYYYFINKIVIKPDNPNVLFAAVSATDAGIWKSTDAGASWSKITSPGAYSKFCTDLAIDSTNPNIMYGAFGLFTPDGIYRTTNGGTTWSRLATGFPALATKFCRISLAIAPSNNSIIYASVTDSNFYTQCILKSINGGANWSSVTTPYDGTPEVGGTHLGGQGWYNNVIAVHPTNPNIVYAGGINLFKSTDGGSSWNRISYGYGTPYVHVDQHAIVFDPTNPSIMYFGCDGGMFKTTDGGSSFIDLNSNLRTIQFYSGAVHPNQQIYYGGTQDNGTLKSATPSTWTKSLGGDGGVMWVDYNNPSIVYTEYVNLCLLKSINSGNTWYKNMGVSPNEIPHGSKDNEGTTDRCEFIAPYVMDPTNPSILVAGTYRIFRTTNGGSGWTTISNDLTGDGTGSAGASISAIGLAKSSSTTIYIGTSGSKTSTSKVYVTIDASNVTPTWTHISKSPLPNRYVKAIAINPNNRDCVYVTYSGYNSSTALTPGHVFQTTNRGTTWTDISGDLPDIPVNTIVIDPINANHLMVGTDLGIYESANGGASWVQQNAGLANVSIADLDLNDSGYVFAATHGRGMFKSDSLFTVPTEPPPPLPPPTIAKTYTLYQNYPNPFPIWPKTNPYGGTTILFKMGNSALITVKIYNIIGECVGTVMNREYHNEDEEVQISPDKLPFDKENLPSGIYLYQMIAESIDGNKVLFSAAKKMVYVR